MFDFYEIVEVLKCEKFPEVVNHHGYIAGKSFSEENEHGGPAAGCTVTGYGVMLFGPEEVYFFLPDALKSTGYQLATRPDAGGSDVPLEVSGA